MGFGQEFSNKSGPLSDIVKFRPLLQPIRLLERLGSLPLFDFKKVRYIKIVSLNHGQKFFIPSDFYTDEAMKELLLFIYMAYVFIMYFVFLKLTLLHERFGGMIFNLCCASLRCRVLHQPVRRCVFRVRWHDDVCRKSFISSLRIFLPTKHESVVHDELIKK